MAHLSRGRRLMGEINVVPYIDVMLVLLVIFMVTAPLVNPGVVDLPSVDRAKPQQQQVPPLEVVVSKDATFKLRERIQGKSDERSVNIKQLVDLVKKHQAKNPDLAVVIFADKEVKYEAVMNVMNEMQKQNVKRVGLMVKPGAS